MPQRLKTINFDYTDDVRWGNYFDNQMKRFVEVATAVDQFRDELVRKCDGRPFDDLQEDWDYSQVLLGGVAEDGSYRNRGLARVYRDLFGLQVENVTELVTKQQQGISPSTTVVVEETEFTDFVSAVAEHARNALQIAEDRELIYSAEIEAEYDFYDVLSDQENLTQLLTDFLRRSQEILPNYNEMALVIWTLDKVPNRYLSVAYPKLKDREGWDWFDRTFGLEPIFIPDISEEDEQAVEKREQYTLYAYREGSLGRKLLELYSMIWETFDRELRESLESVFPNLPNFREEYVNDAYEKLRQIGWEFPEYLEAVSEKSERDHAEETPSYGGVTTKATYHISGVVLDELTEAGYSTSGNYNQENRAPVVDWSSDYSEKEERDLSLFRVLNDLAPMLFLLEGLEYKLEIDADSLEVKKL